MSKKVLVTVFAGIAAVSLSYAALAQNYIASNSDIYIGGQVGYADTGSDIGAKRSDVSGVGGRAFVGFDFNQYIAAEIGSLYTPEPKDGHTYAADLLAKITVPLTEQFGLFAKAGPGYLRNSFDNDGSVSNVDLVYGFGANYKITPNLVADVAFTRYNGNHDSSNNNFQPNTDFYALGLAYKFNV